MSTAPPPDPITAGAATRPAPGGPPNPIVLLHGLGVHWTIMAVLAWRLRKSGRRVHLIGYNSYRVPIPVIAHRVAKKIARLGYKEIDVVAHSMGGIILRYAFNHSSLPTVRRAVMIGTPNRGASVADAVLARFETIARALFGELIYQMRHGAKGLAARAGTLDGIEFGVIAGSSRVGLPFGRLIKGDNDGIVAVQETGLEGMKDFIHLPIGHTMQLFDARPAKFATHFLEHGRFRDRRVLRAHREEEDEG